MIFKILDFAHPSSPGLSVGHERQVSHSAANQSRSESDLVVNPLNPQNLVGASKKFDDPQLYHFHLSPYFSFDGGETWGESSLPLQAGWQGMTDPALTFDSKGNVYLLGEPLTYGSDLTGLGMAVYRSTDGGRTWGNPVQLTSSSKDDKQWMTADDRSGSPYNGYVYAIWGASQPCGFARSTDGGMTWKGAGNNAQASHLGLSVYAPAIVTDSKGWIHIFDILPGSNTTVSHLRSKDGGQTFEAATTVVSGVHGLEAWAPSPGQFPRLPNGHFRVRTMVTAAAGKDQTLVVAWPDVRQGSSRIYYRVSRDGGNSWEGPASGQALPIPGTLNSYHHCFMPQLAATENGTVGCTFYAFGQEFGFGPFLINVFLCSSYDDAASFPYSCKVTKSGWNPDINAPWSHGDRNMLFIGDYFGLTATDEMFVPFWTDTRTGVQEIFSAQVLTSVRNYIEISIPDLWPAFMLPGPVEDGGGFAIIGGKVIRIPPWSPLIRLIEVMGLFEDASGFSAENSKLVQRGAVMELAGRVEALRRQLLGAPPTIGRKPSRGAADMAAKVAARTSGGAKTKPRPAGKEASAGKASIASRPRAKAKARPAGK